MNQRRIKMKIQSLITPKILKETLPASSLALATVNQARKQIENVLTDSQDKRLVVLVGPCSIHDPIACREYAYYLKGVADQLKDQLIIVMRAYFEKPRTTVGWKGLINDPGLNNEYDITTGLSLARKLLIEINEFGMPTGTEFLSMLTPQYYGDLISWVAIGARTTESQPHRELVSAFPCPVGFKNGTDGNIKNAVDAVISASSPHTFISASSGGPCVVQTDGNQATHIILRGGKTPNYFAGDVEVTKNFLIGHGLRPKIMIDCSHGNSSKNHLNQIKVGDYVAGMIDNGRDEIFGVMIESNLVAGNQNFEIGKSYTYGQSITDACICADDTTTLLKRLAEAVKGRQ